MPLAIDLFCGLGGWSEGLLAEGWRVVGFDIERHDYGTGGYPGQLVIQDVLTLHGSQFKSASLIVASPPCQAYSYRAMPWSRAKALPPPDNTLFDACFRIQREACEAAGRYIPLIVENVRGAVKWVGHPVRWHFGSYYLWGDVPALMPLVLPNRKSTVGSWDLTRKNYTPDHGWKTQGMNWSDRTIKEQDFTRIAGRQALEASGQKLPGNNAPRMWSERRVQRLADGLRHEEDSFYCASSGSASRKAASAMIAKIPLPLSQYIARHFFEVSSER